MKIALIQISVGIIFILCFFLVYRSASKLKKAILAYYDFGLFIPATGSWTVIFYLIIIFSLILFSYLGLAGYTDFLPQA